MKITIPNPCSEDWQTMTATEKGRFCAVCQKCVVDFTTMTDAEIIHHLNNQKGKTCGRFTKEQLNRPLTPPNRFKMPLSKWVLASTFSLGFLSPKDGFADVPMVQTQKVLADFRKENFLQSIDNENNTDSLIIKGTVFDADSINEPVVGAKIIIKGTILGAETDFDGSFVLDIPIKYQKDSIILIIQALSYETQEMVIRSKKGLEIRNVKLKSYNLGEPMVVGGVHTSPTLGERIKRLFRKKYY